ncbi:MAG: peptidoglycan bridge formation glycyltransferase FemA/FemB family protein [bacterium]
MQVTHLTDRQRGTWSDFLGREPAFALLQSWEWGDFKEKLGWKAFRIAVTLAGQIVAGAQLLIKPLLPAIASLAYVPRGPVGRWTTDGEAASLLLAELHRVAREHRAVLLKLEPPLPDGEGAAEALAGRGFRASPYNNQPRSTIILDLGGEPDRILMQMRQKTRQYIRSAVRQGVTVRAGEAADLPDVCELIRMSGKRKRYPTRSSGYYQTEWHSLQGHIVVLMAYLHGRLLALRTICSFGRHAAELHAGSVEHGGKLHPNYLLVWEGIRWAKSRGCLTYDFWGVPEQVGQDACRGMGPTASERTDDLWGVYRFKRGFSRNVVSYVGSYDYVYRPMLYNLAFNRYLGSKRMDLIAPWLDRVRTARRAGP